MTTKRQKLQAMAEQDASPNEAAIAKTKLAGLPVTLDDIAASIREEWGKGIEAQFAIGRLLSEAAAMLNPKARVQGEDGKQNVSPYGDWFRAQGFPFGKDTAQRLRYAAENEAKVRAVIAERSVASSDIGVTTAVQLLLKPKVPYTPPGYAPGETAPPTTPMDPAFVALRDATRLILGYVPDGQGGGEYTGNLFTAMHVDDLAESARSIQLLAAAYTEAKSARTT